MSEIARVLAYACVGGLSALLVSGCSSLYLYDAKQEQAAATAKDTFTKIGFAEIQDQQTYLASLATSEIATVKSFMLADRDRRIAEFIKPSGLTPSRQNGGLRGDINRRLSEILLDPGKVDYGGITDTDLLSWSTLPESIRLATVAVVDVQIAFDGTHDSYIRSYARSAGAPTKVPTFTCPAILTQPFPGFGDPTLYKKMVEMCDGLYKLTTAGILQKSLKYTPKSQLGEAISAVATLKEYQAKVAAGSKIISDKIATTLKGETTSPGSTQLRTVVTELRTAMGTVSDAAQYAGAKRLSDELQQILRAQLSAAASPNAPSTTPPSDPAGATAALPSVAAPTTTSPPAGTPSAATPPASTTPGDTTKRAQAVLDLASAFVVSGDIQSGRAPSLHIDSILIALAALRQRLDMAQLEISRDHQQEQIRQAQISALVREVALLARAKLSEAAAAHLLEAAKGVTAKGVAAKGVADTTTKPEGGLVETWKVQGPKAAAALAAYSESWSEGRIPYHLGEYQSVQVDRSWAVAQAAKTAANWKPLLAPAFDQLAADGKGGVKPETIAQILSNLGIIAAIAAK